MFQLQIETPDAAKFRRLWPAMEKRWNDLSPIGSQVKKIVSDRHRERLAKRPVGQMKTLGPSIIRGDIFNVKGQVFEYGTRVEHAPYHAAYRKENRRPKMLTFDRQMNMSVGELILDYVLTGRT